MFLPFLRLPSVLLPARRRRSAGPRGSASSRPQVESLEERVVPALNSYSQYLLDSVNVGTQSIVGFNLGSTDYRNPIVPLYTDYHRGDTYGVPNTFSPASPHFVVNGDDPDAGLGVTSFGVQWDGISPNPNGNAYFQFDISPNQANRPRTLATFGQATAVRFLAKGDVTGRQVQVNVFKVNGTGFKQVASQWFALSTSWKDYGLNLPAGLAPKDLYSVQFLMDTFHDPGTNVQYKLDEVRIDTGGFDPLRVPLSDRALFAPDNSQTFPPSTPQWRDVNIYPNHSFLYDSALDIKGLLISGDSNGIYAAQNVGDALLATARANGSYYNQLNDGHVLQGDGTPRPAFNSTKFTPPQTAQTLGDNAWFGMALIDLYHAFGDTRYLNAARAISDWAEANLKDATSTLQGYFGGFDNNGAKLLYRSTEQNIDLAQLNFLLAGELGALNNPASATYAARADYAANFVFAMFDPTQGKFWTGTTSDGTDTINGLSVPLDVQLWGGMSIGRWAKYATNVSVQTEFSRALQWAVANLSRTDGAFSGLTFSSGSTPGVWFAGSAFLAVADSQQGAQGAAEAAFQLVEQARQAIPLPYTNGVGAIAASRDDLQDPNLGSVFDARPALEPAAWATFYLAGYNPFGGPPVALPFTDSFAPSFGNQLSPPWSVTTGGFSAQGDQAVASSAGSLAVANHAPTADVAAQANIALGGSQYAGLVARYAGPGLSNLYLGEVVGNNGAFTAYIFRNVGGTWTQLATAPAATGTGTLVFEVSGHSLQLLLGGQLLTYAFDSSLTTGRTGLWGSAGTTFANFSATPQVSPTSLLFSDNFAQPDGTTLSLAWVQRSGSHFTAQGDQVIATTTPSLATASHAATADVTVRADITLSGSQFAGLAARYAGPGLTNMYLGELVGSLGEFTAYLFRNVNGTWTQLAVAAAPGGSGTLDFEVVGDSLKLFLNGQLLAYAFDSSLTTGTTAIWGSAGAAFDNFSAPPLPPPQPALFSDTFTQTDGTPLNYSWVPRFGSFTVVGDQAAASASPSLATPVHNAVANVAVQADIAVSDGQYAGLVAHYNGPGVRNMYLGEIVGSSGTFTGYIFRNLGGTWTKLISAAAPGGSGTLDFEVVGSSLKLFFDGNLLAYTYDSTVAGGTTGVWAGAGATLDNFTATAVTVPVPGPLPFSDTFTQADDSQLSRSWIERAGNFSVQSGQARANAAPSLVTADHAATSNVSVQADVAVTASGQYAGLVARYSGVDLGNMYLAEIVNSNGKFTAYLFSRVNGTWRQLTSTSVSTGTGTLQFNVLGTSLVLNLNGKLISTVTDTALMTGTTGMWAAGGATLDNFLASAL